MNLYEHINAMSNEDNELKVPQIINPSPAPTPTPTPKVDTAEPAPSEDYRSDTMKKIESQTIENTYAGSSPFSLTTEESKAITQAMADAIDNGENPYEVQERWTQAIAFSRFYNLPLSATLNSLDALTEYQLGAKPTFTQTGTRAVLNSIQIGGLSVNRAELAEQFYKAHRAGQDTSEIEEKINALDEQIEGLRDYVPRNIVTRILKAAGNSAAYSINVLGASLASQYLGGVLTSSLGLTGPLATAITAAGGFAKGRQLTKYSKYYDLIKAGVDPTAAAWTSELSADIQAAIEAYLGIESRLAKGIAGGTSALSQKIVENMFITGGMDKVASMASKAASFGIGYGVNLAAEFGEEWSQQITEMVFDNMAYTLSEMDAPYTIEDINREALSAGIEGALAAVITGVSESVTSTQNTIKKATDLKHLAATTPGVEQFIEKAREIAPDFVQEKNFDSAMRSIWEQTQNQASQIKAEQSVESTGMANFLASSVEGAEVSEDSVVFSDEKTLTETLSSIGNTATSVVKENNGTYRLTFTDKDGNNEQITFMTREQADSQNIQTSVPFAEGYDEKVRFRGAQVSEQDFLQEEERNYVREGIKNMLGKNASPGLVNSGTEGILVASRMLGIPSDTLIDKKIGINFIEETVNEEGREFNGYMTRELKDGGTFFNINVNRNADTTTLPHEIGHVVRALSNEKVLSSFAKRYGGTVGAMWVEDIKEVDGKYTVGNQTFDTYKEALAVVSPNEERFVDEFLQYLATGVAPTEEAKSIFSQMRQFLKAVVDQYGDNFDPDAKQAFDDMLRNPASVEAEGAGKLYQLSEGVDSVYKKTLESLKNNPANWDGEHWLAPNGKISNLTERQYVLVRTPAFKAWFGDWENDPANASKVLDENGEPKVVYHGTARSDRVRDVFDPKKATSGPMAFFTTDETIAEGYSKNKSDTSLDYDSTYDWENRFRVKREGWTETRVQNVWHSLTKEQREEITERARHITENEDGVIVYDENAKNGIGSFTDYELNLNRGNAIAALWQSWIETGELLREDEVRFLEVLKLSGFTDMVGGNVWYNNPYATTPKVYDVFLSVKNPFDTTTVDEKFVTRLENWVKRQPKWKYERADYSSDLWDKNAVDIERFVNRLRYDVENGTTNTWTSIPDYVTDYLKYKGYDGIKDVGGKYHPNPHTVWIPTQSNQVKSASENAGTFDSDNPSILYQLSDSKKREILDKRETDVQNATYYGFIVPTKILQEYAGKDWADEELAFRKKFADSSELARKAFTRAQANLEAEMSNPSDDENIDSAPALDADHYLNAVEEIAKEEGIDFNRNEESSFWKKVFNYAQQAQETPTARDRKFAAQYARTDAQILNLAKRLANYTDVRTRIRKVAAFSLKEGGDYIESQPYQAISNVWGAYPGVSTKLLRLNKTSTPEQIAAVREMIVKNPRPYREALDKVLLAEERVEQLKYGSPFGFGGMSLEGQLFYQGLGEMMEEQFRLAEKEETEREEYLNAQMTPEESKELKLEKEALEETKKELQAQVSDLERQVERARANWNFEWKKYTQAKKEAEDLDVALKEAKTENKTLKKTLESVRARRDEYRKNASEAMKEVDSLMGKLETARKRLEAQINRINRKKLINNLKKWTAFNPDTELINFADALTFLNRIAKDDRYAALLEMPSELLPYISDELYDAISLGRPLSDWSDSELQALAETAVILRNDARQAKEFRDYARKSSLNAETYAYFKQTFGVEGALREGQMQIWEMTEDMKRTQEAYDNAHKNPLAKMKDTIKDAIIKPQRLARQLDNNSEGIIYNRFVRQAWWNYQLEKANENRRFEAYKEKAKELGITSKHLSEKDFATYKANGDGETISLTRGQAIGVYVYSQNEISARKLGAVGGNQMGMDGIQMNQIIDKLSDNDKAWGDYLIDELGGDATWERMNHIYRTVYNRQLGRRNRYFTFVADGTNYQGETDLLQGPQGNPVAYTDKGMTKEIDEHATYPLDLDVSKTYLSQVSRQEHFIAWASWVRDSNYQLNNNFGGMGSIVQQKFGAKAKTTLQNYVNDVARPNTMMSDIEKLYSKALSNYAVASLAGNLMTVLKQAPSIASALRGDIGFAEFVTAGQRLISDHKKTMEFINSKTSDLKNRTIDQELSNFKNYTELGLAENALSKAANILMIPTQMVDKAVVSQMWLAAYETGIHRGLSEEEAVFKASQLINETQPTSGSINLNEIQRKKSPFVRTMIMFTNQVMNVMNQLWFDLPYFAKTHNVRKFIGTAANIALSAGAMVALSGALLEEDEDKKRKKVWQSIIAQIANYSVPFFGGAIGETYSKGDLISLPGALGDFARSFVNTEDDYWAKVGQEAWDLVIDAAKAAGVPTTPIKRAVDSVENANPFYMFGTSIGEGTNRFFE